MGLFANAVAGDRLRHGRELLAHGIGKIGIETIAQHRGMGDRDQIDVVRQSGASDELQTKAVHTKDTKVTRWGTTKRFPEL